MPRQTKVIEGAPGFGPLREEFDAIEALNAFYTTHGWDCQYRQIGKGRLHVSLVSRVTERLAVGSESVNRRIWGQTRSADGVFSVMIAVTKANILVNGRALSRTRMIIAPPNESMDMVLGRGAYPLTFLVPVGTFNEYCHTTDDDEAAAAIRTLSVYSFGDDALDPIRKLILEAIGNKPDPEVDTLFEESLLIELARLMNSDECQKVTRDPYLRIRKRDTTRRAIEYIHDNITENIRMEDLCELCSSSLSTLERRFKRFLHVSPKQYVLTARLNRVRRDLLDPDYFDLSIAEIAMRYHLLHMGRFSAHYQMLFGRLPSEDREIAMDVASEFESQHRA
ncbi:MAG: helix-turn-helix transcriptional regulator [Woeseiaceae bacterium]